MQENQTTAEQGNMPGVNRELTFGEDAIGLTFNHAEGAMHDQVHELKTLYAKIIDILNDDRGDNRDERARLASVAITEAQGAQMWAVKAVTKKR